MGIHWRPAHDQVPAQARPSLNAPPPPVLAILAAYLLGATPTSYIAGKLGRGIDLREHGSKNLGATNVYRILGWKYALPVALVDIAKGAAPVLVFAHPAWLAVAVGVAAVLGHMFSPYVRFKGGKGVATAAGMFLALAPLAVLIAIAVWGVCLWLTGYVSLSSIIAVLSVPLTVALLQPDSPYVLWASVPLVALIIFAHRRNITRLLSGTESRFRTRGGPSARPTVRRSDQ
ncbi:MAG TPA: glycerol-3-phosphate 1-O-acyltransferase PlsY [Gemmatimonadales bacterium]|nr:glycerol-3-phosphate 1-O-acyltransferase PlsY [Gemmatimonadales bacterium]